jgi:dTDP-4-dehydrorhamnose reductase
MAGYNSPPASDGEHDSILHQARRPKVERILITGVDHALGANLALELADRAEVMGLYSQQAVACPSIGTAAWDGADPAAFASTCGDWRPQWIVHCGPLSAASWDSAERGAEPNREPQLVAELAEIAHESGARLTVISSDVVFAGPRMFHEETYAASNTAPRAVLTRKMEQALEGSGALVVRTHAFGWSPVPDHAGFAEQTAQAIVDGCAPMADGRRYATPILASDLADLLWRAYELRLVGIHHLAGAERTSAFRFVSELAAALGIERPSGNQRLSQPDSTCHEETSLNSRRARRVLERPTPLLREGLRRFAEQDENGWRNRWRACGPPARRHEVAA